MLKVNQQKVEKFFDILDKTATILHEATKKDFIDTLVMTSHYILEGDVMNDDLENEVVSELKTIYRTLEGEQYNKEEIRKAFQLCLLKGFKDLNTSLSYVTPDSIGILFSFIVDQLFSKNSHINVLDATVGTGNLITTMLNNSNSIFDKVYGVDVNYNYLNLALTLAELTDHQIEFIHQDSTSDLITPIFDLVVADLPRNNRGDQLPYKIVSNLMKYNLPGGYFIYLIPNDFFDNEGSKEMKEIILNNTYMQALITLPETMFKTRDTQKSILVLQKSGANIAPTKEILLLNFPSFKDPVAVKNAMDKIKIWFDKKIK